MTKLKDDGSNWFETKDRAYNQLLAEGLSSHLRGTIEMPKQIVQAEGGWYRASDVNFSAPLNTEGIRHYERRLDEYTTKEARGTLILMDILPTHIYLKLRHKPTLREKWLALCDTFENDSARGRLKSKLMYELISTKYSSDKSMNTHLQHMQELEIKLVEVGSPVDDVTFTNFLQKSVDHIPEIKSLIETTRTTLEMQGRVVTSDTIINLLRIHDDQKRIGA